MLITPLKEYYQMSRHVDLDVYDQCMLKEELYLKMQDSMLAAIAAKVGDGHVNILEIGAGTGLFTERMLSLFRNARICASEPDMACCRKMLEKLAPFKDRILISQEKGEEYEGNRSFDVIAICDSCHHIPYDQKVTFLEKMHHCLKDNGLLVIGDEIVPDYNTESERRTAVYKYYNCIIEEAERSGVEEEAFLEGLGLDLSLKEDGEYKISCEKLEDQLQKACFEIASKVKIGPEQEGVGGVYVYTVLKHSNDMGEAKR